MISAHDSLRQASRWKPWEPALWLAAFVSPLVLPSHAALINEIAIVALFAVSLDLILGYTGIVSLGHAAFFGLGAYTAALFSKHVMPDPLVGLAVAIGAALTVALQYVLASTRFGSRLRASVDVQRVAAGMGINDNIVFLSTFAFGSGLAGLGGALGAEVLGLDPSFPLKFMIYFLIVVAVGGTSSITGPLLAALLLGVADVAGKYYIPKMGAFIVYSLMIVILIWRPQGLFVRQGGKP